MVAFLFMVMSFLLVAIVVPLGSYGVAWWSWVEYTNGCLEIFANQLILENQFPLILKFHWYKCLAVYILFLCFFIVVFVACYLALELEAIVDSIDIVYASISIIGEGLLCLIISFFFCKKSWKEMSNLGIYDQTKALILFTNYQNEFVDSLEMPTIKEFDLFSNQHLYAAINTPFQFNQRRYKRKVQRLKTRMNGKADEKYQWQLLKLYINYLKTYAVFFKRITNLNKIANQFNTAYFMIDGQMYSDFEILKNVLISNFFAFAN